jgi:endonuclease YncB( thermonuclease family)
MLHAALLCLVVAVFDGDTLAARCPTGSAARPYAQVQVRIGPIDAPEHGQPYGARAKQALSRLVYKQEVRLDCCKQDRYRRQVCDVWVAPPDAPAGAKTLDAGLAMVTQGMAWWYRHYAPEQPPQVRARYRFAEREARARRAGLWADPKPVAPWSWRRAHPRR